MIKNKLASLAAVLPFMFLGAPAIHAEGIHCSINNGFANLAGMIPNQVGGCLTNEYRISNGNMVQETVGGLLSWNPKDNIPEFTDGTTTWVLGPLGLQSRSNTDHFAYEAPVSNVAGVNITSSADPSVVGCILRLMGNADHPYSTAIVFPTFNPCA
jgi:hypothetical protein